MGILFLLLILGILIWNHFRENKVPSPWEQEQFICIGRVTDIVPASSGKVIYLSKIQELSQEKTPFLLQKILLVFQKLQHQWNMEALVLLISGIWDGCMIP